MMLYTLLAGTPMIVCTVMTTLLVLETIKTKSPSHRILSVFFSVCTLLYMSHLIYFIRATAYIPYTNSIYSFCNLAVYPLYYIYLKSLTERSIKRSHIVWLITPACIVCASISLLYILMSEEDTVLFINSYLYHDTPPSTGNVLVKAQLFLHLVMRIVFALEVICISYLGTRCLNKFHKIVDSYYSATEDKHLDTTQKLFFFFILISSLSFVSNIIGRPFFLSSPMMLAFPVIFFSIILFSIGYIGLEQHFSVRDIDIEANTLSETTGKTNRASLNNLQKRIVKLMNDEQLFLRPNLRIVDISQYLHTNRTYIYKVINIDMNMSFSQYINRLRIDYAIRLIAEHPDMPLSDVAIQSGFTSLSAFYRNYKLYKHSPSLSVLNNKKETNNTGD